MTLTWIAFDTVFTNMGRFLSPHSRDNYASTTLMKRRSFTYLAVFIVFTILLFVRSTRRSVLHFPSWPEEEALGRPGVVYPPEDEWKPPVDWDPVDPVYTNFTSIEQQYSSSIRNLTTKTRWAMKPQAQVYHPYPEYDSGDHRRLFRGSYVPCMGPRGIRLNESTDDMVTAYIGAPNSFPEAPLGSKREVGFDNNVCFERHGRFAAYGSGVHGPSPDKVKAYPKDVKWENVDWASLQSRCVQDNVDRFDMAPRPMPGDSRYQHLAHDAYNYGIEGGAPTTRSAVIFRSYNGMLYTQDMLRMMRSVIMELVLGSGGEHEAYLLVQIKNDPSPIFENDTAYEEAIQKYVPREFWNITVLWSTDLWGEFYPKLPEGSRNVHASQWLPVQYFAQKYSNFDFYWNWEMDVRYTGHHYELLDTLAKWSRKQPRKGLWERNQRFYVPRYHGDYSTDFKDYIQGRYQQNTRSGKEDLTIWGPFPPEGQGTTPLDEFPPLDAPTPARDNFTWGVGEDADLITLLPMFNPDTTHYALRGGHFNYPASLLPAGPPRRATIITFYRLSRRLINTMHQENTRSPGHHMSSEQWPQGVCLHHGFKAVYVPHSLYMDRHWPAKATNFIFNNGDSQRVIKAFKDMPPLGEGSGGWESVFGLDREHNFIESTWYYRTNFATRLYKRLLGYEIGGIGGDEWEAKHGAYCLPPMLLHQIKDMEDPAVATNISTTQTPTEIQEQSFQKEKEDGGKEALNAAQDGGASVDGV